MKCIRIHGIFPHSVTPVPATSEETKRVRGAEVKDGLAETVIRELLKKNSYLEII